ncbi:MAG: uracil phosphoribosyltransferase [Salibacteraceae bacterium]
MIHNLSSERSIVDHYMEMLRSVDLQNDREQFRANIKRIGAILGYEISKELEYETKEIKTPMSKMSHPFLSDRVVIITILRAGIPMHEGVLNTFPKAECGFISALRKHNESGFHIELEYLACPDLTGKILILNDPMLATGQSFITALDALKKFGLPKRTILTAVIASEDGIINLKDRLTHPFDLWVAAIDPELNKKKYIVPGLGDAGDLSFGTKLQN